MQCKKVEWRNKETVRLWHILELSLIWYIKVPFSKFNLFEIISFNANVYFILII